MDATAGALRIDSIQSVQGAGPSVMSVLTEDDLMLFGASLEELATALVPDQDVKDESVHISASPVEESGTVPSSVSIELPESPLQGDTDVDVIDSSFKDVESSNDSIILDSLQSLKMFLPLPLKLGLGLLKVVKSLFPVVGLVSLGSLLSRSMLLVNFSGLFTLSNGFKWFGSSPVLLPFKSSPSTASRLYDQGSGLSHGVVKVAGKNVYSYVSGGRPFRGSDVISKVLRSPAKITSRFSLYRSFSKRPHLGVDLRAAEGTPLYAPFNGRVSYVGTQTQGGLVVRIVSSDNKWEVSLLHLSKALVKKGDSVSPNTVIALSGSSGTPASSTGLSEYAPHLHLQLKYLPSNLILDPTIVNLDDESVMSDNGSVHVGTLTGLGAQRTKMYSSFPKRTFSRVEDRSTSVSLSRSNNPFALVLTPDSWVGKKHDTYVSGSNGLRFSVFSSLDYGLRAGLLNLRNMQTVRKVGGSSEFVTIRSIVNSYTSVDNGDSPSSYASFLSRRTGFGIDEPIDLRDPAVLRAVGAGVVLQENVGGLGAVSAARVPEVINTYFMDRFHGEFDNSNACMPCIPEDFINRQDF